jgi:N,N'-diacetyllegionaminate synthase
MAPREIVIGDKKIGSEHPCYIVAEAGINHNGSLEMARDLIEVAVAAGADAVKFQTFNPSQVFTKSAIKAAYQKTGPNDQETAYEMVERLALSYDDFRHLNEFARSKGITFFSKGHKEDIDFLVEIGVPMLKVDSSQVVWHSYIGKVAEQHMPIILSTGTCTLGDIERALDIVYAAGHEKVVVLQCTTAYPTPLDQINLRAMATLQGAFDVQVGFSDHSEGLEASLAAVALGAVMIEKHFTLDRTLTGPDHQASLEPEELADLVRKIRKVEIAMGSPVKRPTSLEKENMRAVRRSIVAETAIGLGDKLNSANLSFKRPAGGLGEEFMEVIRGRLATRDIEEGEVINWDMVGGMYKSD